jgi:hypothetical protein
MNVWKPLAGAAIFALIVVGGVIVATCAQDEKAAPQTLTDESFNHWRDFIHPSAAESAWERPGWQTSLWAGLTLAQETKKPLMVWFMTGHPCGMT